MNKHPDIVKFLRDQDGNLNPKYFYDDNINGSINTSGWMTLAVAHQVNIKILAYNEGRTEGIDGVERVTWASFHYRAERHNVFGDGEYRCNSGSGIADVTAYASTCAMCMAYKSFFYRLLFPRNI
jgi:hypothetical protein